MDGQAFTYQWQWGLMIFYPMMVMVGVLAFYAWRHWQFRHQDRVMPGVTLRFMAPWAMATGVALGALANSNQEFASAQAHREAHRGSLESEGYVYRTTLEDLPAHEVVASECHDARVVDWDFRMVKGESAVRYHVFCREGEAVMELATRP